MRGSSRLNLVFLHGFLGEGADWRQVVRELPSADFQFHLPDYTKDPLLAPTAAPLETWGTAFGQWLRELGLSPEGTFLVGYSQGGRLALQALESSGLPLRGAVLLSTNPGLPDGDQAARADRARNDEVWAKRFRNEPWDSVLRSWNQQGVFSGTSAEPSRARSDGAELRAAASLESWSLSRQRDSRSFLRRQPLKTYWMMGEKDEKFVRLLNELREGIPDLRGETIPDSGHRILFDQPRALAERLRSVLKMQF